MYHLLPIFCKFATVTVRGADLAEIKPLNLIGRNGQRRKIVRPFKGYITLLKPFPIFDQLVCVYFPIQPTVSVIE